MPKFRMVPESEIVSTRVDLTAYIHDLKTLQEKPNEWGQYTLSEAENKPNVKGYIARAAKKLDIHVEFRATPKSSIAFHVISEAPPKRVNTRRIRVSAAPGSSPS